LPADTAVRAGNLRSTAGAHAFPARVALWPRRAATNQRKGNALGNGIHHGPTTLKGRVQQLRPPRYLLFHLGSRHVPCVRLVSPFQGLHRSSRPEPSHGASLSPGLIYGCPFGAKFKSSCRPRDQPRHRRHVSFNTPPREGVGSVADGVSRLRFRAAGARIFALSRREPALACRLFFDGHRETLQ
jgi:hypothetical protein